MSISVTLNNSTNFAVAEVGESGWGPEITGYLVAIAADCLAKKGGAFTLLADANFGVTYGLVSKYYKSTGAALSTTGVIRLANAETVAWRNAADSADLALTVSAANLLTFNGNPITTLALGAADTVLRMNAAGTATEYAKVTNANVDAAAAIAYSKLALTGAILNADLAGSIAYGKLALTGAVLNADLAGSIAYSKLALTGAILNADLAGSIADTKLSTIATALKVSNSATTAASANTASAIVARDGSGNFVAGTITANLTGNVTGNTSGTAASVTGTVAIANGGTGQTTANAALNAILPSQASNSGKVLSTNATDTSWVAVASTVTTTRGDLISRGAGADARLALGTAGQILTTDGTDPIWSSTVTALTAFTGGNFSIENIRGSEGSGTTTLTNADKRIQVFNLSNGRTCVLPTTSIKAGDVWTLVGQQSTANDLSVQSSAGTAMTVANGVNIDCSIRRGYVRLVALQDTPTTPAHWFVLSLSDYQVLGNITTATGGAMTTNSVTSTAPTLTRTNKIVTFFWNGTSNAVANVSPSFSFAAATIPTRFTPANDVSYLISIRDNAATSANPGLLQFGGNGSITVFRSTLQTTNFTAASAGVPDRGCYTWATT